MAVTQAELRAILSIRAEGVQVLSQVEAALGRLGATSRTTGSSFGQLAGGFAVGTIAANAIIGALSAVAGAATGAAGGIINLSSNLEQARIGFTTMLGSAQKADQFIGQLQSKAESTAFNFPGIQQVAQSFLAMGIDGKNVIPIIDDISNALSAAGHGGDTDRLQRVGQSLSEIAAAGKISGEQIRELSRNGIAVLPLLAEAFGKTTAEVRKMAEANEISSTMFFEAFHSQVALHYGDIQAQQAKTWAVAATNVQDILGRLSTETFAELTQALTAGALAVNDFLHSEGFAQWAADVKASIHEVMAALAPLGVAIREAMGLPGQVAAAAAAPAGRPAPPVSRQARDDWRVPPEAITSAAEYDAKIKEATATVHGLTEQLTAVGAAQEGFKTQIEDIKTRYGAMQDALKAKQDGINAQIEATKTKWEGVLEPLQRTESQLQRLAEDTKASFATILDPLKTQLDGVNRQISDSKLAFEATVTPIQRQIDAITKANTALQKQRDLVLRIADLNLRESQLKALGDPGRRGEIAAQLQGLQFSQDDLERQKEILDLGNKKGNNDKAIAGVQKQLDANRLQQIKLEQQAADLINRKLSERNTIQGTLNDAAQTEAEIAKGRADIETAKQVDPLQAKIDAAKAGLQTVLDPLELQAAALSRMLEDVGAKEAAALKPITDALTGTTRQIQDANEALKSELKPLEDAAKAVAGELAANAAAQAAELAPLEAKSRELDRHSNALDLQKRQLADQINQWKDEKEKIKEVATEAGKLAAKLDLSGGEGDKSFPVLPGGLEGPVAPKVGKSLLPEGFAKDIHDIADAMRDLNAVFHEADGSATNLTKGLGALALVVATFTGGAALVTTFIALNTNIAAISGAIAFITPALGTLGVALGIPAAAAGALVLAIGGLVVSLGLYATNFNGFRDTLNQTLASMGASVAAWWADRQKTDREQAVVDGAIWTASYAERQKNWDNFWSGLTTAPGLAAAAVGKVFSDMGANLKASADLMLTDSREGGSNPFPGMLAAFEGFRNSVGSTVAAIVKAIDPLAAVLNSVADAISHMPASVPGWLGGLIGMIRGGGGGGAMQTAYRPGQGGGFMGDAGPITPEALAIMSGRRGGETYPGSGIASDSLDSGNAIAIITRTALKYGIDPRIAVALAKAESGLSPTAAGDQGHSVGLFQLHDQGQGAGMSFADRADSATNAEHFLSAHVALYKQLVAEGLQGRELAETFGRLAEVSDPQFAYRYGDAWDSLGGSLDQAGEMGKGAALVNVRLNDQLDVGAAVAEAAATAHERLGQIQAAGGKSAASAVGPTVALAAAQQDTGKWAATMAAQQAALTQVMDGQAPAGRAATDAMAAFSDVLGPIERQVASGAISADTLRFKLIDLARATSLDMKPFENLSSGLMDSSEAMEGLINDTADLSPAFKSVQAYMATAGSTTNQAALQWLQAALNYNKAKDEVAVAAATTPTVPAGPVASVTALGTTWDTTKAATDLATTSAQTYQSTVSALDPKMITEMAGAWTNATGEVTKFSDAAHKIGDYLDGHEFHFKAKFDDVPDDYKPGSPSPLENALRGIIRAGTVLNRLRVRPNLSAAVLARGQAGLTGRRLVAPPTNQLIRPAQPHLSFSSGGGRGGDGPTLHFHAGSIVANDPKDAARQIRDELIKHGRRNGGRVLE